LDADLCRSGSAAVAPATGSTTLAVCFFGSGGRSTGARSAAARCGAGRAAVSSLRAGSASAPAPPQASTTAASAALVIIERTPFGSARREIP
jgi:hypothetical protein